MHKLLGYQTKKETRLEEVMWCRCGGISGKGIHVVGIYIRGWSINYLMWTNEGILSSERFFK